MMNHAAAVGTFALAASLAWPGETRPLAQPKHVIPFDFDENTIWLQVKINGKGPFPFMLRTAGEGCLVDWDVAERIGLKVRQWIPGGWAGLRGGKSERFGSMREPADIEVGPVSLGPSFVGAVSLDTARQQWDHPMYGAIGSVLLEKWVVAVDYAARELRLYDPASYEYSGRGYSWPLRIADSLPYVAAAFVFPGRPSQEAVFLVDTGLQEAVRFTPGYAARHGLQESVRLAGRRELSVAAPGAESGWSVARIDAFSLGPFAVHEPLVLIPTGGDTSSAPAAGTIGSEMLRRFTLIFDYRRERIILEPNEDLNEFERYGRNQAGGRIVRIDDVTGPTLRAEGRTSTADGRTVRVGIERARRGLEFALPIRRLL